MLITTSKTMKKIFALSLLCVYRLAGVCLGAKVPPNNVSGALRAGLSLRGLCGALRAGFTLRGYAVCSAHILLPLVAFMAMACTQQTKQPRLTAAAVANNPADYTTVKTAAEKTDNIGGTKLPGVCERCLLKAIGSTDTYQHVTANKMGKIIYGINAILKNDPLKRANGKLISNGVTIDIYEDTGDGSKPAFLAEYAYNKDDGYLYHRNDDLSFGQIWASVNTEFVKQIPKYCDLK